MGETLNEKKGMKSWQADMLLVVITMCWGFSYMLMDLTLEVMDPFTLNMYRFLLGGFVAFAISAKRVIKALNKTTIKYGVLMSLALSLTYICATFGVKFTSISNSGFLCAMTVVFIPFISFFFLRQKQDLKTIIAVLMSVVGIALLTLNDDFSINLATLKGDLLCLGCGFFYGIDVLLTEKAVSDDRVDPYSVGVVQLISVGIINLILTLLFGSPCLPSTPLTWFSTIFLALFCTGLAFVIQPIAQQYTTAARVGIIFTLEPVFNVIVAFFIVKEVLSVKSYIGGLIMVLAIVFMELDFKPKRS